MGKSFWSAVGQLFEGQKFAALLIVLSILSAALGGIGAWPYPSFPISTGGQNTLLVVAFIAFVVGLILLFRPQCSPFDPRKYDVLITNWENGSHVRPHNSSIEFSGTFKEKPPND